MSTVTSQRRYYLRKRLTARRDGDVALERAWAGMQASAPNAALPDNFPARAKLAAAGYSAIEDVTGADVDELVTDAGLSRHEAAAVVAAVET